MYDRIYDIFEEVGIGRYVKPVYYIVALIILTVVCLILRYIVRFIVIRTGTKLVEKTGSKWGKIIVGNKFLHRLSNLSVPVAISMLGGMITVYGDITAKIANISAIISIILLIGSIINSVDEIYNGYEISKVKPIKSLLQVIKVTLYIISGIVLIALLLGENPAVIIGSLGAMTAVTGLIFKDPILGFIAGIQLTANDQIRIGDWIEVSKYSANGTVVELTMTTAKVQNFDKTITSVPTYTLVSDSFINWRGMEAAGGRRIKRQIYIDALGVRMCDEQMIERFKKIELLKNYIDEVLNDVAEYNAQCFSDMSEPVNGRRLTNIGTFRAYISEYLKNHPGIHHDMITMVRQLAPGDSGIPLEIYAFTNTIEWVQYENIQSDIFDHLYSVIGEFGLTVYQKPSGSDMRSLKVL